MQTKTTIGIATGLLVLSMILLAQGDWSNWRYPTGGGTDIEFRWRITTCLPVGCFKDVEFRNNTKKTVQFNYTIWSEGMRDKGAEEKDTGIISVFSESTSKAVAGKGGDRVTRVFIEVKK